MKCARCQHDNPSDAKFCADCGTPVDGNAPIEKSYAGLKTEIEELRRSLGEALEQQTATSEILRVISRSPTDYQPVFNTIVRRAGVVCGAVDAMLWTVDGDELVVRAHHGPIAAAIGARQPIHGSVAGYAVREARIVHVEDLTEADDFPVGRDIARRLGWRTTLSAPLLREGVAIGAILIRRSEVRPFTDDQIALLQTFADQAVIAIENVRLFKELEAKNHDLTTALEQQTATSEILRVISSSPTDVQPVFDIIAARAMTLCDARVGGVFRFDGELIHLVALANVSSEGAEALRSVYPMPPSRRSTTGRAVLTGNSAAVPDVFDDPEFGIAREAETSGFRSVVSVPMLRDGRAIGAVSVGRAEPGSFSERQIELLKTFADQAVIAIENVRLFKELEARNRDLTVALDQQTATAEVLKVISNSPTEMRPVFQAIVDSAVRLCDAAFGGLIRWDGDLMTIGALSSQTRPEERGAFEEIYPLPVTPRSRLVGLAIREKRVVQIDDVQAEPDVLSAAQNRRLVQAQGYRTFLAVPLLRGDACFGAISLWRRVVAPFSEQHIALLQTFAEQAVIAIENVRLFNETKEALEQQTATSEILRVISSSPTDVGPVFDAIADSAAQLCDADDAEIYRVDGDVYRRVAHRGPVPIAGPVGEAYPISRGRPSSRAIVDRQTIHIHDQAAAIDTEFPDLKTWHQVGEVRTILASPLLREGIALGVIVIRRTEVKPFSDKHIKLVQTFADQAVIAIENVRLFTELQEKNQALTTAHAHVTESLQQQTATAEILSVISGSPTDIRPVFDAVLDRALTLCEASNGSIYHFEDGALRHVGLRGPHLGIEVGGVFPLESTPGRAVLEKRTVHLEDILQELDWHAPEVQAGVRRAGLRTVVAVPLLREQTAIGAIVIRRLEVRPFSEKQIRLLKTFADQAVIAIENVRLFKELEARTQELTRSVGELQALGEVGQAISSTLDLQTVLSTIVARATQLSGTDAGVIYEYDQQGEIFVPRATEHLEAEIVETMLATPVRKGEGATGRLAEVQEPVQVPDILAAPAESRVRASLVRAGYRALLAVPLVREDLLIGGLTVMRKATGEFGTDIVELLKTFATQSALAIQNARLFREIEQKSRELEAASRHKSEFLANMSHELRTPLNAIIGFSEVLSERMFGELNEKQDEYLKDIHASGQHLLSLINDILDLSKIEAGRMELEVTDFDLPMTIDNALTLIRERAARRSIALHTTVDERLGQVQADERKIRQVLLNLLSNAIKFTPEGGRIEIGAKLLNGSIEVSVTDTGVGIAPEDQEAVFEEFRQVGTAETKVEGTGLGLALSRKFIELHGGKIWVKSRIGEGSTFAFTVPVRRGE